MYIDFCWEWNCWYPYVKLWFCQTDFPSGFINAQSHSHLLYPFSLAVLLVGIYWTVTVVSIYSFMMTDEVSQVVVPVICCITNHLKILASKLASSDTPKMERAALLPLGSEWNSSEAWWCGGGLCTTEWGWNPAPCSVFSDTTLAGLRGNGYFLSPLFWVFLCLFYI